jgi:TolB-like protein
MKKLLIILLSVVSLTAEAQKPKLAVYMTGDDPVNEIVSSRLVDDFARSSEYTVVERTSSFLAELNKEHAYERSGEVDDEQIAALGQQFGVQFVCVTSVLDVWGSEKYITARIIDAETAEVVASCSSNGSIQNRSELIGALNTLSNDFSKAVGSIKQNNAKKVAVYVTRTGVRDVDVVLGDQLVSGFAKSGKYVAIERTNVFLKKLKAEQGYQQSGAVADDDLIRWGNQSGVHYVCVAKATPWGGDYWITTRMIDVKTGDVVNSSKVEGCTLKNSMDVVRVGQEIAVELSKGTLAEQAEEARLKAEEEARFQAEQERIRAEKEAKRKAEEERQQKILDDELNYIIECYNQGYVKIQTDLGEYLVDIKSPQSYIPFKDANTTHYKYGIGGWRLPTKNEFPIIMKGLEDFCKLCQKHNKWINISKSTNKYWCVNWKESWYYYAEWDKYANFWFVKQPDEHNDFTYAFQNWHVKTSVTANAIYIVKFSKETRDIASVEMTHDFERIKENGGSVSHVFRLPFSTEEIYSMKPTCACVTLKWTQDRSNPNVTLLTATYNPKGISGEFTESIVITLENGETTKKVLKGYVY